MVSFPLSEATQIRLGLMSKEIDRIYSLPDRWLAEELLRLCRRAREEAPEKLKDPTAQTYEAVLVWHLVPEIAKKLGATRFETNEAQYANFKDISAEELRAHASNFLSHTNLDKLAPSQMKPSACEILNHEPANGNPIAMAVDRIAPVLEAASTRGEWLSAHIRQVSRMRGHDETPHWSPSMMEKPAPRVDEEPAPGMSM